VSRGLRNELAGPARTPRKRHAFKLVTVPGGLPPGLDLSSREAMHDFLRRSR